LNNNGIESKIVKTIDENDNIYIIFNPNSLNNLPKKYIVYNFEQLTTDRIWPESFFNKCKNAIKVLDYSLENIKVFNSKGIKAHHLPYGWNPTLEINYSKEKEIDVLFLGTMNEKRHNIIKESLKNNSEYKFFIHSKCFGDQFKKVCMDSKIGLNIHYYEGNTILELTRIIPFVCSGIVVISEESNDKYYDEKFKDIIFFCKKDDIPNKINEIMKKYDKINIEDNINLLKKRLNYCDIVKNNINLFNIEDNNEYS